MGIDLPLYPEVDKRDVIYYGSFHAVASGIITVCSGGNSRSAAGTVEDVAPWVISVAASTMDKSFPTIIMLGNNKKFTITLNETWVSGRVVLWFTLEAGEENIKEAQTNVRNSDTKLHLLHEVYYQILLL
ncbi:unnamed protein product [Fraxinus pennsylvanica]|uniref:Uncharacterized protein n=1 Tax=Fraxinus pennsylvanica TaxID=56036 RepID=A0AAD2DW59_9LAMI|nr:unnamed protein product [Fraxinus pennsylvanica]